MYHLKNCCVHFVLDICFLLLKDTQNKIFIDAVFIIVGNSDSEYLPESKRNAIISGRSSMKIKLY